MPAAPCESSPDSGSSCGGDFSLGKMTGHVDLPHRRPGPPPHCRLCSAHPCQLHRVGAAGGGGGRTTASLSAPGASAAPWPSAPRVQPLLAATGGHYLVHPASSSGPVCPSLPFPGTDRNTHIAFFSFAHTGQGRGAGQLTAPLGRGQASWCQCGLGCPSSTPKPPRCLSASPACHDVPVQQLRVAGHGWRIFSEARG